MIMQRGKVKKIKTSTKIGLAGSIIYCSALALPVLANTITDVQPINIEQITTAEQAEDIYQQKLTEYAGDKKINSQEVENLYKIWEAKGDLLEKQRDVLVKEYHKKEFEYKDIGSKIRAYQKKMKREGSTLNQTREKLEKNVLKYYPALINKGKGNMTYSAEAMIESELNSVFREIALETDKILKEYYDDNSAGLLVKKKEYTLNNVLTLYAILTAERERVYPDKVLQEELTKNIAELEKKEGEAYEKFKSIRARIYLLDDQRGTNSKVTSHFQEYNDLKKEIKEFEERYGNFDNQPFMSILADHLLKEKTGLDRYEKEKEFNKKQEGITSGLEEYIKENTSFDVKVELPENPADFMFNPILGIFFGLLFPIARNMLIKGYMRGSVASDGEWVGSLFAGFGNGFAGLILLDGLHPLVWPVRICSPLIFQPIFKIFKWHPLED